jgi:Mg2+ and Co2+ transporter CorA
MAGKMTVAEYRAENTARLVKLEQRQISIFKILQNVEKSMEKINGQVQDNKNSITQITTIGSIFVFIIPVIVSLILKFL